jgi:hypothetical protein
VRRTFGRCDHHQSLDGGAATNSSDSAQALTSMRQQPEGRLGQRSGMSPEQQRSRFRPERGFSGGRSAGTITQ